MAKRLIFAVQSPLGYQVTLDRNRWRLIVRYKHPAMDGREKLARECIAHPTAIRQSESDADVHLHYRNIDGQFACVVTAPIASSHARMVVTAYFTKKLKKGRELWTK